MRIEVLPCIKLQLWKANRTKISKNKTEAKRKRTGAETKCGTLATQALTTRATTSWMDWVSTLATRVLRAWTTLARTWRGRRTMTPTTLWALSPKLANHSCFNPKITIAPASRPKSLSFLKTKRTPASYTRTKRMMICWRFQNKERTASLQRLNIMTKHSTSQSTTPKRRWCRYIWKSPTESTTPAKKAKKKPTSPKTYSEPKTTSCCTQCSDPHLKTHQSPKHWKTEKPYKSLR